MQSQQLYNPAQIQVMADESTRHKDLFQILLDQHYSPAMPIISATPHQQVQVDLSNQSNQGCKCTKIDCLKLYCQCFARGRICNENCICVCCGNKMGNQHQIYEAKKIANWRNPGFFHNVPAFVPIRKCTCKKSQCRKKYCQCFSAGIKCTDECQCHGCQNGKCHHHKDQHKMYQMGIQVNA